jgi:hypothetical protein
VRQRVLGQQQESAQQWATTGMGTTTGVGAAGFGATPRESIAAVALTRPCPVPKSKSTSNPGVNGSSISIAVFSRQV